MGVVYKAEDTRLDRVVALKFLAPHLVSSEDVRKRFIREAKTAAALQHPNICTVYEIDEADGRTFRDGVPRLVRSGERALGRATQFADGRTLHLRLTSTLGWPACFGRFQVRADAWCAYMPSRRRRPHRRHPVLYEMLAQPFRGHYLVYSILKEPGRIFPPAEGSFDGLTAWL